MDSQGILGRGRAAIKGNGAHLRPKTGTCTAGVCLLVRPKSAEQPPYVAI